MIMVQRQMHITTRNSIARKLTVYNGMQNYKTLKADFYLKIFELHLVSDLTLFLNFYSLHFPQGKL